MGAKRAEESIGAEGSDYMCVLCGSVWNSSEYQWGAYAESRPGAAAGRCDWSCPQCGGVVVEYAERRGIGSGAESDLARPRA